MMAVPLHPIDQIAQPAADLATNGNARGVRIRCGERVGQRLRLRPERRRPGLERGQGWI